MILVSLPDLEPILEPTLIPIPIDLEHELPIFDNHISLLGKNMESQILDLDSTLELKPTLEPKLDLTHITESVLVLVPFILEPKSSIPQNHISLLDLGINHNDSVMIFQEWSYNRDKFNIRILHDPIHVGDCKYVNRKKVID